MRKKQKMLKVMKDSDYGFSVNDKIHINIQRIWEEKRSFDPFAREFASTYAHELLHIIFAPIKRKRVIGEEKVVRKMLNEPWDSSLENIYSKT